jgi:hypothetical protein
VINAANWRDRKSLAGRWVWTENVLSTPLTATTDPQYVNLVLQQSFVE